MLSFGGEIRLEEGLESAFDVATGLQNVKERGDWSEIVMKTMMHSHLISLCYLVHFLSSMIIF